jgi:hypothetical protein
MYSYCVWCYLELHVCTVVQWLERDGICDWGGALWVLGFRLPGFYVVYVPTDTLTVHSRYALGTFEARKKLFPCL